DERLALLRGCVRHASRARPSRPPAARTLPASAKTFPADRCRREASAVAASKGSRERRCDRPVPGCGLPISCLVGLRRESSAASEQTLERGDRRVDQAWRDHAAWIALPGRRRWTHTLIPRPETLRGVVGLALLERRQIAADARGRDGRHPTVLASDTFGLL